MNSNLPNRKDVGLHWFECGDTIKSTSDIGSLHLGGKAVNLVRLCQAGFNVPPFFVVPSSFFQSLVSLSADIPDLIELVATTQGKVQKEHACRLRAKIADCQWSTSMEDDFRRNFGKLVEGKDGTEPGFAAVRSSATDEDSSDYSFAGMHDSFLFVRSADDAIRKTKQVWASIFNDRAIAYRQTHGIELNGVATGVVVQLMIEASVSGVVFTCNPANGNTDEMVVSSLYGAGEGLVSSGLAADTFTLNKSRRGCRSDIVDKQRQMVLDGETGFGLNETAVEESKRILPSLNREQLNATAIMALAVEKTFRCPQDIEFCIGKDERLFVLQTRPVTRQEGRGPAAGNRLVWDNSNIIESYSGVTTPMTFSFIRRAYTIVYHCFADVMGISPARVQDNRDVFENMLGLIRGRVYYNLKNWYRLIRLFPGYQYNASFMESMMGLKEPLVLDDRVARPGFWKKWFVEFPALIRLLFRALGNFARIRRIVRRFETNFRQHFDRWDAMDFSALAAHELKDLHDEMEDTLLWKWKAPIINDFYVMIYFGLLKVLCRKWAGDTTGSMQNDLICGEGGVESAEPAKMLLRLASIANKNQALRTEICEANLMDLPRGISGNPEYGEFNELMALYLKQYGFRCMNELKLEERSLRDRPEVVYQVLRNYLGLKDQTVLDVDAVNDHEQEIRRKAEQKAFEQLGGFRLFPRKTVFRHVMRAARLGVKNRENMRFARTRIYGLLREILRAMGQRMVEEGILDDPDDIFYLTIDEVWDSVRGTAVSTRLGPISAMRRAEFDEFRDMPDPDDRFETFGFVYRHNQFKARDDQSADLMEGQIAGIGCCPGVVTNKVRVLTSPTDDLSLSGEILVAQRTDPGWIPLYPAVSGILIERGSVLSHSAVVAREMGIPTIVSIKRLLDRVSDGDIVRMDGGSGVVEIVSGKQE